jgi:hypothetical protein
MAASAKKYPEQNASFILLMKKKLFLDSVGVQPQ